METVTALFTPSLPASIRRSRYEMGLLANGWDSGTRTALQAEGYSPAEILEQLNNNPYRNNQGATQ